MADKYVGLDVHKATTSFCVMDHAGPVAFEGVLQTRQGALTDFVRGLSGDVAITLEEGAQSTWLYDVLEPLCTRVVVCDPRRLHRGHGDDKSDRDDAKFLAQRLREGQLHAVYKGGESVRDLRALVIAYENLVGDAVRTKNRVKAVFRSHGIPTGGRAVYRPDDRDEWLVKLPRRGLQCRAALLFAQLDAITDLWKEAKHEMLLEARRFKAHALLATVPGIGQVRSAQVMAWMVTPHRFRTRRQLWRYAGLAVVRRTSADYAVQQGAIVRSERVSTRGLNRNHNRHLKVLFKAAAVDAIHHGHLRPVATHPIELGEVEGCALDIAFHKGEAAGVLACAPC